MSYRTSRPVFDSARFRADVVAYMQRWHLSGRRLAASGAVGQRAVAYFLRGDTEPSLLVACALADICDLSLNTYRASRGGLSDADKAQNRANNAALKWVKHNKPELWQQLLADAWKQIRT